MHFLGDAENARNENATKKRGENGKIET